MQIHLPNGQVVTLAQPIPEELTAPMPSGQNTAPGSLSAGPTAMPVSRPPMSPPPLASALPQDVRQRILALFVESPDPVAPSRNQGAVPQGAPPQQPPVFAGAAATGTSLQPGAHLQVRVVAVQIGSQQPIEIDPAAHLAGGKDSQIVFGRVIAVTPAGHAVIHTPAGNILLQQKSSLPVGAQLALAVDTIEAPAPTPVIAGPVPVQTPQQALLSLSQGWPTLADIVAILQGGAPMAARGGAVDATVARQVLAHLPQMGSKLGAGMMNAIAALRSGEIGRLMGPLFAARGLGAEREETVRRLRGEFAQLSTLAQERPEVEWRALFLPYLDDHNRVQRINLYYRRPRGGDAGDDEKNGTRFVVEADFTRLGPFQLDGLMRQQRFDLMVRSRIRLDERMRRDIEAIYEEARGLTGFAGSIAFQTVDAFPVMPLEELKQSGERV